MVYSTTRRRRKVKRTFLLGLASLPLLVALGAVSLHSYREHRSLHRHSQCPHIPRPQCLELHMAAPRGVCVFWEAAPPKIHMYFAAPLEAQQELRRGHQRHCHAPVALANGQKRRSRTPLGSPTALLSFCPGVLVRQPTTPPGTPAMACHFLEDKNISIWLLGVLSVFTKTK
jgi:hypothetical protein